MHITGMVPQCLPKHTKWLYLCFYLLTVYHTYSCILIYIYSACVVLTFFVGTLKSIASHYSLSILQVLMESNCNIWIYISYQGYNQTNEDHLLDHFSAYRLRLKQIHEKNLFHFGQKNIATQLTS